MHPDLLAEYNRQQADALPDCRVIADELRRAKILHKCGLCNKTAILAGDLYNRVIWVEDGKFNNMKICQFCKLGG